MKRYLNGLLLLLIVSLAAAGLFSPAARMVTAQGDAPTSVTIAGTIQAQLGCPGDWQPECEATFLKYDEEDDVWYAAFNLKAGDYEYKAALNKTWDENYGAGAAAGGANITLSLSRDSKVSFYYDHKTHWITDNVNSIIATAPGSYQSEIGCSKSGVAGDWDPSCLRSWLQDPDGDGKYTLSVSGLKAGDYEMKVAINESWGENYGSNGARDGSNISFTVPTDNKPVFFEWDKETKIITVNVEGAPRQRTYQAHWVSLDTILWKAKGAAEDTIYTLHYDANAAMTLEPDKVAGGQTFPLVLSEAGVSAETAAKFPHLAALTPLILPGADRGIVAPLLMGQLYVSATAPDGTLLDVSGLQIPGVLDDLYSAAADVPLGVTWDGDVPTLRLWAPTARNVSLLIYPDSTGDVEIATSLARDEATGVWSVMGDADWKGHYFLYEVTVFTPATNAVEVNRVTDPYTVSLSMNSRRSQMVNLNDADLQPEGWASVVKPALAAPEDSVIYELHIRDFSIFDETVPEALRGTFAAFTVSESNGMKHLAGLAKAGLTHLHLLPFFDIATVEEDKTKRQEVLFQLLQRFPPDSARQQELVNNNRALDGFNWGYDPYHYNTPEGSYSTNPDGTTRILELREAVKAINATGLRVVMDVVYNHTNASGQNEKSVLDKIVPGYYHRLNFEGKVERSTCCENTASEHLMMEKLLIDSVLFWATEYKIDAFRFDLMGHHMKANMVKLRERLDGLTIENSGVDGKAIYVYGEGWNFGEVGNNQRGENATQINMAGTGIGTFNDRLRDAVRGGSPFGDRQKQGFVNGLWDDPNATTDQGTPDEQLARLLLFADQIRVGMAGNLRGYTFENREGKTVTGAEIDYNGAPAGYADDPQENIVYAEKHDNETLWDMIAYKAPVETSMADRVRMQNLGVSIVLYSQGVPFVHAGMDLLRSKSMDRDSYDSGDWFNRLDFTYETNNFGAGLPTADKNKEMWDIVQPLLGNSALKPAKADILRAADHFRETLAVRQSSRLFRLRTAEEIQKHVKFLNTGTEQIPGVLVVVLDNTDGSLDDPYAALVIMINVTKAEKSYTNTAFGALSLELHPILAASTDEVVKGSNFNAESATLTVPARTAAVFVMKK
ncbi:MAG TPA: pullulanase-type alpha-1,6-glucosidase [Aggregatilineales bacterium]|nr:pullulanase-type alpha-1,6-glucosidase [Anaerolineales bacterium]HRE47516.1 pullulanase-type alpha-1,6-glucosidase [Aggregatilineales bacterium]